MISWPATCDLAWLARRLGGGGVLCGLLAMPEQCLCGEPYPSAHALLAFILAPQSIIMSADDMSAMPMMGGAAHDHADAPVTPVESSLTAGGYAAATGGATTPTIQEDTGHVERAGSFSALAGLLVLLLVSSRRRASDTATSWRGIRPRPATSPPRRLSLTILGSLT